MRGSPEEMNTPVRPTETPRPGAAVHATSNRLCFAVHATSNRLCFAVTPRPGAAVHATSNRLCFAVRGPTPRAQLRVLFGRRSNGPLQPWLLVKPGVSGHEWWWQSVAISGDHEHSHARWSNQVLRRVSQRPASQSRSCLSSTSRAETASACNVRESICSVRR